MLHFTVDAAQHFILEVNSLSKNDHCMFSAGEISYRTCSGFPSCEVETFSVSKSCFEPSCEIFVTKIGCNI